MENNTNSINQEFYEGDTFYYFDCEKYCVLHGTYNSGEDYTATKRYTEIFKEPDEAVYFGSVKLQRKKYELNK